MTYHSNVVKAIAYMVSFDWGMRITNLNPPFYETEKNEKTYRFWVGLNNHRDSVVDLKTPSKHFDYGVIVIPNKRGDNIVLVNGSDIKGLDSISFEALAKIILWKNRIDITRANESKST